LPRAAPSPISVMLSSLTGLVLAAFLSLLVAWPPAYAVVPLAAAALALVAFVWPRRAVTGLSREDIWFLAALAAFSLIWLADVARTGVWPRAIERGGLWLPLWPLLAAFVWLGWRRLRPPVAALWWGVGLGAVLAGLIAGWEVWMQGHFRASNGINAIPFGMLSLLLGSLAWVGVFAVRSSWARAGLLLALAFGLGASLLSGTRGSWVVFPALVAVVGLGFWRTLPRPVLGIGVTALLGLLLLASLSPTVAVTERVGEALESVDEYDEGERGNSFGVRVEMWRVGVQLFSEKPLLGWGEGRLQDRRDDWVAAWDLHPAVSKHDQLHSDLIDTAARRGLVGLVSLLMLYGVPLVLFARALRGQPATTTRAVAVAGLVVVVAFIGFGLTQSMLRDARGLAGYLGLVTACWCLLRVHEK
jgi:O-antigen ligase